MRPLPSPPFPPVSSLPSPPKESSLPPSAGSAGFCFYITCTHAGSWAAWGGREGRGGTRGDEGAPPPSRTGKRRSAAGRRAQPGTGRPRGLRVPGPGGRREHSPQWPPPKGLNGRRKQIVGRGRAQGVKCRLGSSEQRSLYSKIVTAVTGTLGSEEPTLGKLEGFASRESQLNAD